MPFDVSVNFGYPWWLTYGHVPIMMAAAALLLAGYFFKWPKTPMVLFGILFLWSSLAFAMMRFGFNANGLTTLPTENFLRSGTGRVLDMGAGTGRSSMMVLQARPQTTVIALDLFGKSFDDHFGAGDTPQQRLLRNLKACGVDQRVTVETADMRKLPFAPATFDAIVSAYAIDHLNRDGIHEALGEAARVLKPGGEFLLMVINKDAFLGFAFGPLLFHAGTRGGDWWTAHVQEAGFDIAERGTRPATFYLLARRRGTT